MADTRVMNLPDGRELAWIETGEPQGYPVFMFHGTPGSRLSLSFDTRAIEASGVRLITPDRPGYGHSSFHRGRTLANWASDVVTLADHLTIEKFAVSGFSGGGPHALACARLLADRVTAAGIVSGTGPLAEPEFSGAMEGFTRAGFWVSARAPFLLYLYLGLLHTCLQPWPEAALRGASRVFPQPDLELLERPDVRAALLSDVQQPAWPQAQDMVLDSSDWGFRLQDISVPVHVWHGDADMNVPFLHGKVMAERIPRAQLHPCPGEGHLLVLTHLEEILRTVSAAS